MDKTTDNLFATLWDWLRSWFVFARVSRQLSRVDRRLTALEHDREKNLAQLKKQERVLQKIHVMFQSEWTAAWNSAEVDIENSRSLIKQYEAEIEALRFQIEIHEELNIPGLTNGYKVVDAQAQAMIATANQMRQIALETSSRNTA